MYNNILLPIDRGKNEKAAKEALKIANKCNITINVLYVKVSADKCLDENKEIEPIHDMRKFFESNNYSNVTYNVKEGKPMNIISNYSKSENADLIIMATHRRSKLKKLIIGSVTDKTIQNANCPVLTVSENI